MEAERRAPASGAAWRLWALVPILLLAVVVGALRRRPAPRSST